MNFFMGIFQGFYLLFRNTYLKEHLSVAASVSFNREASHGSKYILGKILLPGVVKYENTTFQTISRKVLISWREKLFTSK